MYIRVIYVFISNGVIFNLQNKHEKKSAHDLLQLSRNIPLRNCFSISNVTHVSFNNV